MEKPNTRMRNRTLLLVLLPTLLLLWLTQVWDSPLLMYLSWIGAPVLAIAAFRLWLPCNLMPSPPSPYTTSPLLQEDAFALSGAQFFPVRADYTENPPHPPVYPTLFRVRLLAWVTFALGVLGCLVPFFCIWASFLAVTLSCANQAGFASSLSHRPVPIRRLTLLAFCLGLAGVWSSVMVLFFSLHFAG